MNDNGGTGGDQPGAVGDARVIQITPQMRVLVAVEPVDGRKGIDSLARLCQDKGSVCGSCGKRKTSVPRDVDRVPFRIAEFQTRFLAEPNLF